MRVEETHLVTEVGCEIDGERVDDGQDGRAVENRGVADATFLE